MAGPFDFIQEIREMNVSLTDKLERIIERLDTLIQIKKDDFYGDGR